MAFAIPVVAAAVDRFAAAVGLVIGVAVNEPPGVSAELALGAALPCRTDAAGGELPQATPANRKDRVTTTIVRGLTSLGRGAAPRGSSRCPPCQLPGGPGERTYLESSSTLVERRFFPASPAAG